jgi:predicted GNAT family acetyltransferase
MDPAGAAAQDTISVRQVGDDHFAVSVGGVDAGRTDFRDRPGDVRVFTHTEVDPAYEGRGLASVLIRAALDATRSAGLHVRPLCPFVRAFIERHEDYANLLAEPLEP